MVVFDDRADTTHVSIVDFVHNTVVCVRDIDRIACKVGHVLFEFVRIDVNIWLGVDISPIDSALEVGRHDVDGASNGPNVLLKDVSFDDDWSLVCVDHERAYLFISCDEASIIKIACRVSHLLEKIFSSVVRIADFEKDLTLLILELGELHIVCLNVTARICGRVFL